MRIAVVNEASTLNRNADVIAAVSGRGHEIVNIGMRDGATDPELTYVNTGFLAALLLITRRADLVVGGCGTGQGFHIAASQYPGVICGHITSPLDAWLYAKINAGNCVSLALNQGYGWAADMNLLMIFDRLLEVKPGAGFPLARSESQRDSRAVLANVAMTTHRPMAAIVQSLPLGVVAPVLAREDVWNVLDINGLDDEMLAEALQLRHAEVA